LTLGLQAVAQRAQFAPFVLGAAFTAADCAAYVHFTMIKLATRHIYGEDLVDLHVPAAAAYMQFMDERPHVRTMMAEREAAMAAFVALNVPYDG
jgi:glutathione S-transferase